MLFFIFFLKFVTCQHTTLSKVSLEKYSNAVCNDGTKAVYYYKAGTDDSLWVVNLQGGGWCYDDSSCTKRCSNAPASLCGSSKMPGGEYASTKEVGGILDSSPKNPARNAHKVFVQYCSSDGWMGRSEKGPLNFKYKGSHIVEAVMTDIVDQYGLGKNSNSTTTVIFGGQSAGGRGAMFNVDYISKWFSNNEDVNVRVVGWLDSPYWIPMDPMYGGTSLLEMTRLIHAYANNSEVIRENCVEKYSNTPHYCMFGFYTMPFVKTQSVMESATFDTFQLGTNIGHAPKTKEEIDYVYDFATNIAKGMESLSKENENLLIFGPACCNHAVSESDAFEGMVSNGLTEADLLKNLLSSSPPYDNSPYLDNCAEDRKTLCCGSRGTNTFKCDFKDNVVSFLNTFGLTGELYPPQGPY